jgi:hypothetical protein
MREAKDILKDIKIKSRKIDDELISELKISKKTFYNIKGGATVPRSLLFLEKLHKLAKKYGVNN